MRARPTLPFVALLTVPVVGILTASGCQSRGFNRDSSRVMAPANQPINFRISKTTQCSTGDGPATVSFKHPVTKKDVTITYNTNPRNPIGMI